MAWYATKKASKLPTLDKTKIIVFDVETTGLLSTVDEIIQITILDGYGNELFSSYIKPTRHKIWTEAQRINGIRYEMVKNAPTFRKVKKEIQEIFNNAKLVVGYNLNFDIEFIEACGIVVPGTRFDVMTAFASYRAGIEHSFYRKCKLTECAEYFNYSFKSHDSDEDARATLHCFNSLIADGRFTTYRAREKIKLQGQLPVVKKKTRFTIAFQGGFFRSLFLCVVLVICGVILLTRLSNIVPVDLKTLKQLVLFIQDNILNSPLIMISTALSIIGLFGICIRLLRKMFIIPKWLLIHIKRMFK